jgi:hypothetical protein
MSEISKSAKRLYEAAERLRDVRGQSAVARLLGVSPQVMKNWELRDVSEGGALLAQIHIGCDANWILGQHGAMQKNTRRTDSEANEDAAVYLVNKPRWPFTRIHQEEWQALSERQRHTAESLLRLHLDALQPELQQRALSI